MKYIFIAALTTLTLASCGQKTESQGPAPTPVAAAPAIAPVAPEPPPFTKMEWRAAFKSAFDEKPSKSREEGITEYTACLKTTADENCVVEDLSGKHDAFRKADYLRPFWTKLNDDAGTDIYVGASIVAPECSAPAIVITPTVNSENGWLFMNKVAFMADGDVVAERSFESTDVKRDNARGWIHERAGFVTTPADLVALRNFTDAKSTVIRISGQKGYITLPKKTTGNFVKDMRITLKVLDTLNQAFTSAGGPTCTTPNTGQPKQ